MFSVPAFFAQTPAERNDKRMNGLTDKIASAEAALQNAISRLDQMREAFANLTEEDMAGLDFGQCQNLGSTTGRFVADVQRSVSQAHEALTEVTVVGSGFESVV